MAEPTQPLQIAFLVYEKLTVLDLIGPYEVLHRLPNTESVFVALEPGAYTVESGLFSLGVPSGLADVPEPDIVVVPGGAEGTMAAATNEEILTWLRHAHAHSRYTTSVCTGSLILAAAGLLAGKAATTHWAAREMLDQAGAHFSEQRVVEDGKIITAAGVSAGIDMALTLAAKVAGDEVAQALQLGIEYDPQPPFDSGSLGKASEEVRARAASFLAEPAGALSLPDPRA